jgi:CRP-like cAMP-binding protein
MSSRALYQDASPLDLSEANRQLRHVSAEAGETLMDQADAGPALAWIVEGQVEIRRDGVVLDTSGPGEVIGEMSLFTGKPRFATVVAKGPVKLLVLDEDGRKALLRGRNEVLYNLERAILAQQAARFRVSVQRVQERVKQGEPNPYAPQPPSLFGRLRSLVVGKQGPAPIVEREVNAAAVLRESHLFRPEPADALGVVAMSLEKKTFRQGDFLLRQGEPGDAVYVIGQGHAELFVSLGPNPDAKILKISRLGPGAAAGVSALLDDLPAAASCVAAEQVDALRIDKARWKRFLRESTAAGSAVRSGMIRALSELLAASNQKIVEATGPEGSAEAAARLEHATGG